MAHLERKDRIKDTTTTTGTGTVDLAASAPTGFRIFAGNVTSGASVRYLIESSDSSEWEVGEGIFTDGTPDTLTRVTVYASSNAGSLVSFSAGTKNVSFVLTAADIETLADGIAAQNLLKNGNFINNSTNGYGSTPDDWTSSNANPVQGGIPALTKQNLIDGLGVADGDIEGLWPLNALVNTDDFDDLSANAYDLDSATHVPAVSSDGLMGGALDFESGSAQYGTILSAANTNLKIAGSKTYFAFVKAESLSTLLRIMGHSTSAPANYTDLSIATDGAVYFQSDTLTTNQTVFSDVKIQIGKWFFVCGVYDSANTKLKVWVNGIKKEVTASGTQTTTGTNDFSIGRLGAFTTQTFDGLIQNAGVLSVALSDDQVKKLFAMTMYKGQKIRRATTDAYIYQDLPMNLVEHFRGKTITFAVDMAQDTSSIAKVDIVDSVADSASTLSTTLNTFEEFHATRTIAAAATSIRLRIKAVTSDGTVWAKNARLYEGSTLLPFDHSKDDWSRFPRLLQMDIPDIAANGYQYEEKRFYDVTIGFTGWSVNPTTDWARIMFSGKMGVLKIGTSGGTSNSTSSSITQPFKCNNYPSGIIVPVTDNSAGVTTACRWYSSPDSRTITLHKDMYLGGWTASGTKNFGLEAVLDID